jgi:hypothetical protein
MTDIEDQTCATGYMSKMTETTYMMFCGRLTEFDQHIYRIKETPEIESPDDNPYMYNPANILKIKIAEISNLDKYIIKINLASDLGVEFHRSEYEIYDVQMRGISLQRNIEAFKTFMRKANREAVNTHMRLLSANPDPQARFRCINRGVTIAAIIITAIIVALLTYYKYITARELVIYIAPISFMILFARFVVCLYSIGDAKYGSANMSDLSRYQFATRVLPFVSWKARHTIAQISELAKSNSGGDIIEDGSAFIIPETFACIINIKVTVCNWPEQFLAVQLPRDVNKYNMLMWKSRNIGNEKWGEFVEAAIVIIHRGCFE